MDSSNTTKVSSGNAERDVESSLSLLETSRTAEAIAQVIRRRVKMTRASDPQTEDYSSAENLEPSVG